MVDKEHHGFLYGVAAALASSGTALFIKLSSSATVMTIAFARFLFGMILMLAMIYFKKNVEISWRKVPKNLTRSIGGILSLCTYFYAVQNIPLVNAVTLSNTSPLFLPFIALVWLKLIVSKKRMFAVFVGFIGVVILLRPTVNSMEWPSIVGLSSGLFGAIALMSVRQLSKTENTETILTYYFIIGTVITFFFLPWDWKPVTEPLQWIYILGSCICAFLYQIVLTKAYTHAPATKVSSVSYLAVVFSGLFGWWVFGEIPDIWVFVGTLFIICGALIALFDRTPSKHIGK